MGEITRKMSLSWLKRGSFLKQHSLRPAPLNRKCASSTCRLVLIFNSSDEFINVLSRKLVLVPTDVSLSQFIRWRTKCIRRVYEVKYEAKRCVSLHVNLQGDFNDL